MAATREIRIERDLHHVERLLAAMGGSPEGWEWTGEITEGDPAAFNPSRCACGHVIRWEYHWLHKDGRKLITGSVCVENLPGISAEILRLMCEALAKILEARKEDERKAKEAARAAEVQAFLAELQGLIDARWGSQLRYAREVGGWLPADVYSAVECARYYREQLSHAKHLKTARGQADCLRAAIKAFRRQYEVA